MTKQRTALEELIRTAAEVHRISDRAHDAWVALSRALKKGRDALAQPDEPACPCGTAYLCVEGGYVPVCACAAKNAIERGEAAVTNDVTPPQWISVDERYPEVGQDVVYFFDVCGTYVGKYIGEHCFGGECGFLTDDVTHWMPYKTSKRLAVEPTAPTRAVCIGGREADAGAIMLLQVPPDFGFRVGDAYEVSPVNR